MGVIDGATRQLLYKVAVGAGAHSVAVDSGLGEVYVTFQAGTSTAFANGGMSVFATK
jgi:DNA-binding beta-propeller fold protein YncE